MTDNPTSPPPSLEHLLSSEAEVLHETRRPYVSKRIVESRGEGYVLYRAPSRDRMLRFAEVLRKATASGVSLQSLVHDCDVQHPAGHWLVLRFASGQALGRPGPRAYRSLGRVLASLHGQESDRASSLLRKRVDPTPHERVLARTDLDKEERRWISQSSERLYRIERFQLTHGDLHRQNILINANQQVSLIDYELFAFEPAGLELAMVLLRPYSRHPRNRQLLLEGYLATCREGIGDLWHELCADLLFAGALRLAAQRSTRARILKRQSWLLTARKLLGRTARGESTKLREAKQRLMDLANARMHAYDAMAISIARCACANPDATVQDLLTAAHGI
jgi:hypothetical protein